MLNDKLLFLGICVFAMVGCNEKLPYIPDFEQAGGVVIGSEHCKRELVKNAWLIQFKALIH